MPLFCVNYLSIGSWPALLTHGHETDKKMGEALLSSTLQPEDPQQGSDSSSLMQMNHGVKTTPHQRGILGPAASPARGQEPPEGWPIEVHKDQRPKKHGVFREFVPTLILFIGEHDWVSALYREPVGHLLGMRDTHHGKDSGEFGPTRGVG
jgi:hypothetical protein